MKDLTNDLNKIVSIYGLSIPISRAFGVVPNDNYRVKLLNDMLSLMFYYSIIVRSGIGDLITESLVNKLGVTVDQALIKDLIKTVTLILVNSLLSGKLDKNALLFTIVGVIIYHTVVRPFILKQQQFVDFIDYGVIEDMAEAIIIISITNNNLIDMSAHLSGLIAYHKLLKMP